MRYSDYLHDHRYGLADLGDATPGLQAILDAGLNIPPGYYQCAGTLWHTPGWRGPGPAARAYTGRGGILVHAEVTRASCRDCGTVRPWFAPGLGRFTDLPLECRKCGAVTHHDETDDREAPRSAEEAWQRGRVIRDRAAVPQSA